MIYVKKTITSYVSKEVKSDVNSKSIWIELTDEKEKQIIGNFYRPPNLYRETSALLFQEINVEAMYRNVCIMGYFNYKNVDWINTAGDHKNKNVCTMGDFNYRNVDWINIVINHKLDDFIDIIEDNFLKQIVSESTREDSILDLIIRNKENLVSNMEIDGKLGSSDQQEMRFKIKRDTKIPPNQVQVPEFRKAS